MWTRHERIGKGGFSVVFRVSHKEKGTDAACKVLASCPEEGISGTTVRELCLLTQLEAHPNVLSLVDWEVSQPCVCVYTPLAQGTLSNAVRDAPPHPFPPLRVAHLCAQLWGGLSHLHSHQYVHRDVKPENVLVYDGWTRLVLSDFGLARRMWPEGQCMTREVVTLWYRPPEVALGRAYNAAVDVWSMALTCAFVITGGWHCFQVESETELLTRMASVFGGGGDGRGGQRRADLQAESLPLPSSLASFVLLANGGEDGEEPTSKWTSPGRRGESMLLECLSFDPRERCAPSEAFRVLREQEDRLLRADEVEDEEASMGM